jgi:hypothetical protein
MLCLQAIVGTVSERQQGKTGQDVPDGYLLELEDNKTVSRQEPGHLKLPSELVVAFGGGVPRGVGTP